jgi:propionyl-CoA carboxylase beta chain
MELGEHFEKLRAMNQEADLGGGLDRIEAQHAKGKLTARERVHKLLDPGTFEEFDKFVVHRCYEFDMEKKRILGDGVVTGYGKIQGRPVFVFSQDFTVFGGSLSGPFGEKVCKIMDLAVKSGCPVIGLNDSGGARIQEGVVSLASYGDIFLRNVLCSGVIPQISAIMGPCAGGAVYSPALTDFIFMVDKTSYLHITGPEVLRAVTSKAVTSEELGGAKVHSQTSGLAHFVDPDDEACLRRIRELLTFLPQNYREKAPCVRTQDDPVRQDEALTTLVPANPKKPYDIKKVIRAVVDDGYFFELHEQYARNMVVGFARFDGQSVGIVANQPMHLAGCIDVDASLKCSRFVRTCDCFNIPLVTFVDVPGFLPAIDQEARGIIKHGAKIIFAYSEATVPKITVITRKAYGGAYDVMSSKHLRGDINLAYPTAEIAVMGPEGAVNIVFRREMQDANDPDARAKLVKKYRESIATPYRAASLGYIDEIIDPRQTRPKVINALQILKDKEDLRPKRKHGNIPL